MGLSERGAVPIWLILVLVLGLFGGLGLSGLWDPTGLGQKAREAVGVEAKNIEPVPPPRPGPPLPSPDPVEVQRREEWSKKIDNALAFFERDSTPKSDQKKAEIRGLLEDLRNRPPLDEARAEEMAKQWPWPKQIEVFITPKQTAFTAATYLFRKDGVGPKEEGALVPTDFSFLKTNNWPKPSFSFLDALTAEHFITYTNKQGETKEERVPAKSAGDVEMALSADEARNYFAVNDVTGDNQAFRFEIHSIPAAFDKLYQQMDVKEFRRTLYATIVPDYGPFYGGKDLSHAIQLKVTLLREKDKLQELARAEVDALKYQKQLEITDGIPVDLFAYHYALESYAVGGGKCDTVVEVYSSNYPNPLPGEQYIRQIQALLYHPCGGTTVIPPEDSAELELVNQGTKQKARKESVTSITSPRVTDSFPSKKFTFNLDGINATGDQYTLELAIHGYNKDEPIKLVYPKPKTEIPPRGMTSMRIEGWEAAPAPAMDWIEPTNYTLTFGASAVNGALPTQPVAQAQPPVPAAAGQRYFGWYDNGGTKNNPTSFLSGGRGYADACAEALKAAMTACQANTPSCVPDMTANSSDIGSLNLKYCLGAAVTWPGTDKKYTYVDPFFTRQRLVCNNGPSYGCRYPGDYTAVVVGTPRGTPAGGGAAPSTVVTPPAGPSVYAPPAGSLCSQLTGAIDPQCVRAGTSCPKDTMPSNQNPSADNASCDDPSKGIKGSICCICEGCY